MKNPNPVYEPALRIKGETMRGKQQRAIRLCRNHLQILDRLRKAESTSYSVIIHNLIEKCLVQGGKLDENHISGTIMLSKNLKRKEHP
jgi:hypothetical protein